jgi:nitrous oxide reductase accessory protein NosL
VNKIVTSAGVIFSLILLSGLFSISPAADRKPVEIKKSDKCQVCGMLVFPYPNWAAEIVFNDGTYAAFDGPKDMFRYYFSLGKFNPSKKQSDIAAVFVTEYYSTRMMDAHQVFFIKGSDVEGPMGAELVAVESADKAKVFMKDHKGKKILKFIEVRMEDLK